MNKMKLLCKFLNVVLKSSTLASSDILENFLKQAEPNAVAVLKRTVEKMKKPEFLLEMSSPEGVLLCDAENDTAYFRKLTAFVSQSETLKSRLRTQSRNLTAALEGVANCLNEMKESFKEFDSLHQSLSENKLAREIYFNLAMACSNWRIHEQQKAAHIDDILSTFYLYQANELLPLKELLKEREASFSEYVKTDAKIFVKKEKLWAQGDISKWEMSVADRTLSPTTLKTDKVLAYSKMMANENLYVSSLKDRYAFFNYQARIETAQVVQQGVESELAMLREFSRHEQETWARQNTAWTQLNLKLANLMV